jgi:hypothetical protein
MKLGVLTHRLRRTGARLMFLMAAGGKRLARRLKGFLHNVRIKPLKPWQCRYSYEVY